MELLSEFEAVLQANKELQPKESLEELGDELQKMLGIFDGGDGSNFPLDLATFKKTFCYED